VSASAAERLIWAVEVMGVQPADRVLEVGCGHGVAVSLIAERLTSGTVLGIDRSARMIEMARQRNRPYLDAGRAELQTVALANADFGDRQFDKVLAFHVNVFWRDPARELAVLGRHLAPNGSFYLFDQPLVAGGEKARTDRLRRILAAHSFTLDRVLHGDIGPRPVLGAVARQPRA
jgi:SAM-dependent methyltransferase